MRLWFALGALLALGSTSSVALGQTAQDLAGLWRRLPAGESGEKFYRLAATGDDVLEGALLNPPEGLDCRVSLRLSGKKLTGAGTWVEGEHEAAARWELTIDGPGKASGRLEWLDWSEGTVYERGWEPHRFELVRRVGLVVEGDGQAEEPFGDPIDAVEPLAGGWAGLGGAWSLEATGRGRARLVPVGHGDGRTVDLEVQRGVLRGTVAGLGTAVELAWSDGKLDGRAAWTEGQGEVSQRGWAAVTFTRLRDLVRRRGRGGRRRARARRLHAARRRVAARRRPVPAPAARGRAGRRGAQRPRRRRPLPRAARGPERALGRHGQLGRRRDALGAVRRRRRRDRPLRVGRRARGPRRQQGLGRARVQAPPPRALRASAREPNEDHRPTGRSHSVGSASRISTLGRRRAASAPRSRPGR
ncbi:MAG: hypothetical protein KIT58_07540 [Planctomycetota bacterium]|nr:hypothetical protein [Planctomycetota bacterium]